MRLHVDDEPGYTGHRLATALGLLGSQSFSPAKENRPAPDRPPGDR
jgi:hypothetical protein